MARKRKASKKSRKFYAEQTAQSRVKAEIITKYAASRVKVMTAGAGARIVVHIDLWAGRGRYEDGAESTPLMVLRNAIADPVVQRSLVTIFNDKDHAAELKAEIAKLPGVGTLAHAPDVSAMEVGPATPQILQNIRRKVGQAPALAFLDPWGYIGLTRDLIRSLLRDWGCEVLFFFNFNRVNMDITNPKVTAHMEALFGQQRLATLRARVAGLEGEARERVVIDALYEMLREVGAEFIMPFRFVKDGAARTSHYLIFAGKHFVGYKIMRDVMGKAGWRQADGVPAFEHAIEPPVLLEDRRSVDVLAEMLAKDLAGTMMTVGQVFERHSRHKLYVERNYKDALLKLEEDKRVTMAPPANERRPYKGKPSLRDDVRVTFPRLPATGAKATASRSTPARPASDLPPSASRRPIA
jgi:three-Cys-motif partner protein